MIRTARRLFRLWRMHHAASVLVACAVASGDVPMIVAANEADTAVLRFVLGEIAAL